MPEFLDKLIDFLFPTACVVCGAEGPDLCDRCMAGFGPHKPQNYEWTASLWNYRDPQAEQLMRYIKNNPNARVAEILAKKFAEKLRSEVAGNANFASLENVIIVPIPIGRARWRTRGYNQSLLLARPLAKILKRVLRENILIKSKQTKKQGTTKNKSERLANLQNSFAVPKSAAGFARGRDILIVDDITTTGSTLVEARKTLLAAGARSVVAITVAN